MDFRIKLRHVLLVLKQSKIYQLQTQSKKFEQRISKKNVFLKV